MNERQRLGYLGENFAEEILILDGYQILERNFRCKEGEIDIIAEKDDELFFIEVKTRRNQAFGDPCEAVDRRKIQHLRRAARLYFETRGSHCHFFSFQVIEIGFHQIKNAF